MSHLSQGDSKEQVTTTTTTTTTTATTITTTVSPGQHDARRSLDFLADLLVEIANGEVTRADVHATLCSDAGNLNGAVHLADRSTNGPVSASPLPAAPTTRAAVAAEVGSVPTRPWQCPSCGAVQTTVDVRRLLRSRASAAALSEDTVDAASLTCERCGAHESTGAKAK